ncbi:MAG: STAS domain-containing protein [Sulfuricella sp.]|nr:STAS domain-containing protein [Sulfuricella sp.]
MQITVHHNGNDVTIAMSGRFDFNAHREFRNSSEDALKAGATGEIMVDMDKVEYLDSSALGMLLLLREKANSSNRKLSLLNCKGIVQQVLEVANFNKLFTIR